MHAIVEAGRFGTVGAPAVVAAANVILGSLGWALMCLATSIVATIRVMRKPAYEWKHRTWSKAAWVAAALLLTFPIAGLPVPVGAIAAIWRTRPSGPAGYDGLPREQGGQVWPWGMQ